MIALLALSSFSCSLLDKADVKIPVTLPVDFPPVDDQGVSSSPKAYSDTQVLNAELNAEVAKYKSKIKSFTVLRVYYEITDYAGNAVIFTNGSLKSNGKTIASKASLALANISKTEFTAAEVSVDGFNELANTLKTDLKATIAIAGTFSKTPVKFKVRAYFDVEIVAGAL